MFLLDNIERAKGHDPTLKTIYQWDFFFFPPKFRKIISSHSISKFVENIYMKLQKQGGVIELCVWVSWNPPDYVEAARDGSCRVI